MEQPVVPRMDVTIQEETAGKETGGHYGAESIAFDAPGNAVTTHDVVTKLPIALLASRLDTKGKNDGDRIGFDVGPELPVGALEVDVAAAVKVIPVPVSVIALLVAGTLYVGQNLILDDGASKDDCGAILGWDDQANTVTTSAGTTNAFATATPTAIKITTSMSPCVVNSGWVEVYGGTDKLYMFGDSKIGGSHIPAGTTIRIRYDNRDAAATRVVVIVEYLY